MLNCNGFDQSELATVTMANSDWLVRLVITSMFDLGGFINAFDQSELATEICISVCGTPRLMLTGVRVRAMAWGVGIAARLCCCCAACVIYMCLCIITQGGYI